MLHQARIAVSSHAGERPVTRGLVMRGFLSVRSGELLVQYVLQIRSVTLCAATSLQPLAQT